MNISGKISAVNIYKRLLPFIKNHKIYLSFNIICSLISFAIPLMLAYSFKGLTNAALSKDFESFFGDYFYILIAAFVANIPVSFFRSLTHNRFVIYTIRDLRNYVFNHVGKLSIPYHESKHSGDLNSRLNNDIGSVATSLEYVNSIVFEPLIFVGVLVYDFTINWKLLLATVIMFPLTLFVNNLLTKVFPYYSNMIARENSSANILIQETIEGIHIIKSFQLENLFIKKFSETMSNVFQWGKRIEKRNILITPLNILTIIVPMVVVNIYGGYLTFKNEITIGDFVIFLYLLPFLTGSINNIRGIFNMIRTAQGAIIRIFEVLDEPYEENLGNIQTLNNNNNTALEFENVAFSYKDDVVVLNDINFKLPARKKLVIAGASGSGKTTLFKLLCGFYKPSKGIIKVFGENINDISKNCLRENIAIVSQDTYLFPVTIMENIAMGRSGATDDEIIKAAKAANAHDFIVQFPEAYNTIVSENSTNLSGGQKQRIALARALLKEAPLILFDEPTSAIDSKTEADLQESMKDYLEDKSVVIISHRLSATNDTDEVIVIKDGEVIGSGRHEYLLNTCDYYKNLYTIQTSGDIN